jgi:hypothetical protein
MNPARASKGRLNVGSAFYAAATLAVLIGAGIARFRLPQTPLIDPDYGGYLWPALSLLTGHGFPHIEGRDSLYPGFVFVILKLTGDFRAIAIVQRLLGLATGALMLLASRRGSRLLRYPSVTLGWIGPVVGLLPAAAYLSAPSAIQFEQSIRPEAIFPFVAALSICLNLEFIHRRWIVPSSTAAAWLGAGQLVVSIIAWKLKPSFGFALLFVNAPMIASLLAGGVSARSKILMVVGGTAFCALFLLWPESSLKRSDPTAYTFLPDTLLTIHAGQVRDQLAEDLAANRPSPFPRETVRALLQSLDAKLPLARRPENAPYPSLGYSPDYLLYTDCVYKDVVGKKREAYRERAALGYYFYQRAFLAHPGRMLGKIWRQLRIFYHFGATDHAPVFGQGLRLYSVRLQLQDEYRRNVDLYSRPRGRLAFDAYPASRRFVEDSRQLSQRPLTIVQEPLLTCVQRVLETLYLPGVLATLLMTAWIVCTARWREEWLLPAAVTLLILSYNFGNSLTVAVVHSLDNERYVHNQLVYTLLGSTFSLMFIGETLRRLGVHLPGVPAGALSTAEPRLPATVPLPALTAPGENSTPPTLSVLITRGEAETKLSELMASYSAVFPTAHVLAVPTQPGITGSSAVLTALGQVSSDIVICVSGDGSYPAEGGRRLFDSYCQQPADFIAGVRQPAPVSYASRMIRLTYGWHPADLSSGLRLYSRRFYENVPIYSHGLEWEVEATIQAINYGFQMREVTVPFVPPLEKAPTLRAQRLLRLLWVSFFDLRPLRCCGILAGVLFLLSLGAVLSSPRVHHTSHHATPVSWQLLLAATLLILSGLTLQTGILLESGLRRHRETTQLRIRDWMHRPAGQ